MFPEIHPSHYQIRRIFKQEIHERAIGPTQILTQYLLADRTRRGIQSNQIKKQNLGQNTSIRIRKQGKRLIYGA